MLRFVDLQLSQKGTLAALLRQAYAPLLSSNPDRWGRLQESWDAFDHEAYSSHDVGRCVFLTYCGDVLVGFGSFDPRGSPLSAKVGHHCILPPHQGCGFGHSQLDEILRRLYKLRAAVIHVSTLEIPFFEPARRLYQSTGFQLSGRTPWETNPDFDLLHFQKETPAKPADAA